ncbi:MAG: acyl-phosphate glycerol 3-phosphate acyltransferase [Candidatus Hydrothermota bacterium]|nr:MAG: acyl-phosphate glycerol 3-phosphate acyltransferase [Candidatus Hydrothermae bacterium]
MRSAIFIISAYFMGSIPFGYIIASMSSGIDVRKVGSGNIGATNVTRTAGPLAGILTMILDVFKGAFPAFLALKSISLEVACAAGFAAFLGHITSPYMGFRGGKGVATALGVTVVLAPKVFLAAVPVGLLLFFITRKVSVASLTGSLAGAIYAVVLLPLPVKLLAVAMVILIFVRHRSNIKRLLSGEEPSFHLKR